MIAALWRGYKSESNNSVAKWPARYVVICQPAMDITNGTVENRNGVDGFMPFKSSLPLIVFLFIPLSIAESSLRFRKSWCIYYKNY